jgi:hypothetical protein
MTARFRRGTRRCKPDSLSYGLAAIWRYRTAHLGTIAAYLLGKNWFREVVAMALFLIAMVGHGLLRAHDD